MPVSEPIVITEPGLYDLPEDVYHSDPVPGGSLSSSTAKKLIAPSCPAIARWESENRVRKAAYDFGHVAHKLVLGEGAEIAVIDYDDWRTKAAKEARAAAYEAGQIPVKRDEMAQARALADAVLTDPIAGPLFSPGTGVPEQSIFWVDDRTGQWRRAMLDWFPDYGFDRPIIVDLKTTTSVAPGEIRRSMAKFGYHQQAAWYIDAAESVGHEDPAFVFVFVQKDRPHLVGYYQLDDDAMAEGRARNARALDVWAQCRESGIWPGYTDDIEFIGLPRWAYTEQQ